MQFQVPQFIEVEDKIVGPLTFKQFVFIAGGFGMAYVFWRLLPLIAAAPLIVGSLGFAAALAFLQINGRPFLIALEHGFYFFLHPKLYLWSNARSKKATTKRAEEPTEKTAAVYVPRLTDSRLHELSWSLDINERIAAGTTEERDRDEIDPVQGLRTPQQIIAQIKRDSTV